MAHELLAHRSCLHVCFAPSVVVALGTAATLSSGCSTDGGSASKSDVGSIGLALQLASGTTLNSVSYTITGPSSFSRAGTIDTSQSTTITAVIGGLPAGSGFSIALDGTTTDGGTHCLGAAPFDVAAHATTAVSRAPHLPRAVPHGLGAS